MVVEFEGLHMISFLFEMISADNYIIILLKKERGRSIFASEK